MEHIVGIKVHDKVFGEVGFITWGRIFDRVDSDFLLKAINQHLDKFGITTPTSIELCDTLQELSAHPYFYEALFAFAQKTIPFGKSYQAWRNKKKKALERGEDIYFLGLAKKQQSKNAAMLAGRISHGVFITL